MEIIAFVIGLQLCYLSGPLVKLYLRKSLRKIELVRPDEIEKKDWEDLVSPKDHQEAEKWLGFLERILAFVSFSSGAYVLVGGWLVFKLGCKWQILGWYYEGT